jgi:dethiobiotin synthetase
VTARGVFVTGTDTGVGKTVVACALLRGLRARGLAVGAMKPVETGVGSAGPLDAIALREAAGSEDPLHAVCPHAFALAAAPSVAAAAEGRTIGLSDLLAAFERLAARRDLVVVEGAGGLLVPIDRATCMADLAAALGLPLLIVARASLGTINHTLLTLAEAKRRGLAVAGVVISHAAGELTSADEANLSHLRRELGPRLLGEVPPLAPGELPRTQALQLDRLLARLA